MARIQCARTKYLPLVASSALFISVTAPYVMSVVRKKVRSFLPYVSHAAGFPPQSALYSIFMTLGALFGVTTFVMRFAAVEHRRYKLDARKVKILNKVALVVGVLAAISVVFASHFPIGFVTHDKHDWAINVILPHFFGSAFLVLSFTLYILLQSYLTYAQRKKSAMNVSVHATLAMVVVVLNWTTSLPFYAAMRELIPRTINDETGEINLETQEYSFYYIISSLSGWIFLFAVFLFIASFFRDLKRMKVTFTMRPKLVKLDTLEGPVHATNGDGQMTKM